MVRIANEVYFSPNKKILIELPDFEYVRLKKSFRRKASPPDELLTNIDTLLIRSIPTSLKSIEKRLLEIHQNQSELLDQTKKIQIFLGTQFELVIENQTQIEEYLFQKLGSEFEKIKHLWSRYKEKQISGKEFMQEATKILGPKFGRIFAGILFLF